MSKGVYYSCRCRHCRRMSSAVKGEHKRRAHRKFRQLVKEMLRRGDDSTPRVSSGYLALGRCTKDDMLPHIELQPGFSQAYRSGCGHKDVRTMLKDLCAAVWELGKGKAEVLANDGYSRPSPTLGFCVYTLDVGRDLERQWEFFITLQDFNATVGEMPPGIQGALRTTRGRAALATMIQEGLPLDECEGRCLLLKTPITAGAPRPAPKDENIKSKATSDGCRPLWADGFVGWAYHCTCPDNKHGCDQQCSVIRSV